MTIAAKLLTVNGVKTDIKAAIEAKGVDMTDVAFSEFADKIHNIPTGGTGVTFFNKTITTVDTFAVSAVPTFTTYDHDA